ncbi:MAG: hypothetical protein ACMUIG_10765 [Thermoplasmatota archaeon]
MKESRKERLQKEVKLRERELAVIRREYKLNKKMHAGSSESAGYLKRIRKLESEIEKYRRKVRAS